ncbi:unnamed protein product [Allacma fusca]|uniref:F-box domain-containing protein n=1 Tax=Allacma fusca TaxID=39272 RepID=A0A8J2LLF3_9HEXA|nr:unnamed protein product [Allacma fusca]
MEGPLALEEPQTAQPQGAQEENDGWNWNYIPELIKIEIFKNLDVKRLLLLRTISHSWDATICDVLRHKVSVYLRAHFSYTKHSKCIGKKINLFVQNHSKSAKFKSYAIHAEGDATSKLKGKKIQAFLAEQAQKPIHLPALTHFNVFNKIDLENPNGFTAQVINGAPNLTHLRLEWYGINKNLVPSLNLKNIKVLKLSGFAFSSNESAFPQLLQSISETIQELYTEDFFVKLGSTGIPRMPNLKTLHVLLRWSIHPQFDFTQFHHWLRHDNLPVLTNLGLMQVNQLIGAQAPNQIVPHDGVRKLCIEPNGYHIRQILQHSLSWFRNFRNKFPGINSIDLSWYNYGFLEYDAFDKVLADLVTIFPSLECLALRNSTLKPVYFTGVEARLLELYRQEDWLDLELIPRKTCLRNLRRLKKLVLDDKESLTSEMIRGIAELSSLEIFEFQWNTQLSVEDIINHLQHLKVVSIGNCCKTQLSTPMSELFMRTGNVRCGCKDYKDEIGFFRDDYCENAML